MANDKGSNSGAIIRKLIDGEYIEDLFDGPFHVRADPRYSRREQRFVATGPVADELVVVFFRRARGRSIPLNARKASADEKRLFECQCRRRGEEN